MRSRWFRLLMHGLPPLLNLFLIAGISVTTAQLRMAQSKSIWACIIIPLQIAGNWIQFIRNRSHLTASSNSFPGSLMSYKECQSCDLYVPKRSHHCPYCRRCIFALDHHCYFLCYCVGRRNIKYFTVFSFYAALGCGYGLWHIFDVMTYYREVSSPEAIFYFFPFTGVMYLLSWLGVTNSAVAGFEVYYVCLLNFGLGAMLMSTFLCCMGLFSTFTGITTYEDRKNLQFPDNLTGLERLREVFGPHGYLHFLCPFLPFREAEIEPAYRIQFRGTNYVDSQTYGSGDKWKD